MTQHDVCFVTDTNECVMIHSSYVGRVWVKGSPVGSGELVPLAAGPLCTSLHYVPLGIPILLIVSHRVLLIPPLPTISLLGLLPLTPMYPSVHPIPTFLCLVHKYRFPFSHQL